jgi:hypothetical protein
MLEARIRHSDTGLYYVDIYDGNVLVHARAWYGFSFWFARLAGRRILRRHQKERFVIR